MPFPETLVESGMILAAAVGLLVVIAPNLGRKPKPTADGWRFPVKPTCLLLYYLALGFGVGAVAFGARQLLFGGVPAWVGWSSFGLGFLLVPLVLADWPEALILDGQGLLEGHYASSRIRWQELKHVREYRIRCDRGVIIQGDEGKELVVAHIAYDSGAVLKCLLQWRPVPYYPLQDEVHPLSILRERNY